MLSKRNLYVSVSGEKPATGGLDEALLWTLFYSDGEHDLIDICHKTKLDYDLLVRASEILKEERLIK